MRAGVHPVRRLSGTRARSSKTRRGMYCWITSSATWIHQPFPGKPTRIVWNSQALVAPDIFTHVAATGVQRPPGDSPTERQKRSVLFEMLGNVANDPQVVQQAQTLGTAVHEGPAVG